MYLTEDGFMAWNEDTSSSWVEINPITKDMIVDTFYIKSDEIWARVDIEEDGTYTFTNQNTNETGTWNIVDGKLVIDDGDIKFSLISKTDTTLTMKKNSESSAETWYREQSFTADMLIGKTFEITDNGDESGTCQVTFHDNTVDYSCDDGDSGTLPFEINEDGVLVLDEDDMHYLMYLTEDGFMAWNGDIPSSWVEVGK
jgi:hypothetical protein